MNNTQLAGGRAKKVYEVVGFSRRFKTKKAAIAAATELANKSGAYIRIYCAETELLTVYPEQGAVEHKQAGKSDREDPCEPTPLEALQYIADNSNHPSDTLQTIRQRVALHMASRGEYFTSAYRHGATPLHEMVYSILGGTVTLNHLIDVIRRPFGLTM